MNVVITGEFPESTAGRIVSIFPRTWRLSIVRPENAAPALADADALIPEHTRVDAGLLDKAPGLRLVQTGAGFDNVDIAECARRGILVCGASGVNADAVAEHVMALILCWYKNIAYLDRFMRERGTERTLAYSGAELSGKTIGILGPGTIGRRVARLSGAFGMRVLFCGRSARPLPEGEAVDLDRLLAESDILSIHVPLNRETEHMFGETEFEKMKKTALLVNTSRGAVIRTTALIEALRTRAIGGACLDVYEEEPLAENSPLRDLPNTILTPHTAGLPDGAKFHERRYAFFARNIQRLADGQTPEQLLRPV